MITIDLDESWSFNDKKSKKDYNRINKMTDEEIIERFHSNYKYKDNLVVERDTYYAKYYEANYIIIKFKLVLENIDTEILKFLTQDYDLVFTSENEAFMFDGYYE